MASPQLENGYTQIANELLEALARINLSPYESRLLWFIIRKTYGYQKKTDVISLGQFTKATGIPTQNVIHTLKRLIGRNIIIKTKNLRDCEYGIEKHYDQWLVSIVCTNSISANSINANNKVLLAQTIGTVSTNNKVLLAQTHTKEIKKLSKEIERKEEVQGVEILS